MSVDFEEPRHEAMLYDKQPDGSVLCQLCPHYCHIGLGEQGKCQVRENQNGTLLTLTYHQITTEHINTIEKKPLFHFLPGSHAYSIAAHGCNLHCPYCINWEISQPTHRMFVLNKISRTPAQIVDAALTAKCQSIAYTYVEPTIFIELVHDTGHLARTAGLLNVAKTNGYMTDQAIEVFSTFIDAANVDLKSFREATHKRFGGSLHPVLDCLRAFKKRGVWLEVSTVVIPGVTDDEAEARDIAQFIVSELGPYTPWHIARFFPAFQMQQLPPTSPEKLRRIVEIGLEAGLHYVYLSGFLEPGGQDTLCPNCHQTVIRRTGSRMLLNDTNEGCCPTCHCVISGLFTTGQIPTGI